MRSDLPSRFQSQYGITATRGSVINLVSLRSWWIVPYVAFAAMQLLDWGGDMTETTSSFDPLRGSVTLYSTFGTSTTDYVLASETIRRSFAPYARRIRPVVPELNPTSQLQGRLECSAGWVNYTSRRYNWSGGGSRHYVARDLAWVPSVGSELTWDFSAFSGLVSRESSSYWVPMRSLDSEQLAQNDALRRLAEVKISPMTTAAEAAETAGWFSTRAKDIVSLTKSIKSRDWKTFRGVAHAAYHQRPPSWVNLKTRRGTFKREVVALPKNPPPSWNDSSSAASRWLEVRYAVTPLMGEAEAYANFVAEMWEDYSKLIFVEGESWRFYSGAIGAKPRFWPPTSGGGPGASPLVTMLWKGRIVDKRAAYYRVKDVEARARAQSGLTTSDAGAAAWEVIPWSFVFDWGISFGQYLSLLSADIGLDYVTGWTNCNVRARVVDTDHRKGDALAYDALTPRLVLRMNRRTPVGAPRAFVVLRSAFGTKQMLDSIALLRTFRKFH